MMRTGWIVAVLALAACAGRRLPPLPPAPAPAVLAFSPLLDLDLRPPALVRMGAGADPWTAVPGEPEDPGLDADEFRRRMTQRFAGQAILRVAASRSVSATVLMHAGPDGRSRVLRLRLRNDSDRVLVSVDFPRLGPLRRVAGASLALPYVAGWKYDDPLDAAKEQALSIAYPVPASMPWLDYHTAEEGLYLGADDPAVAYKVLSFGGPDASLGLRFFPYLAPGGEWESPEVVVAPHAGDWHAGADLYRRSFERWARPAETPRATREIAGWTWLTIRNQKGEAVAPGGYDDIPERLYDTLPHGIGAVQLAGWFHNGHDTDFPDYRPIDKLGGWEALRAAVEESHEMGGRVLFYFNGRLANLENATYQRVKGAWEVLGPDGQPVVETYGANRFAVLCPSVAAWREHLIGQVVRLIRETGADGAFIDQVAAAPALLCHNRSHGHATPASAFGPGYLAMMRELRDATRAERPDFFVWVEGTHDAYGQFFDAHQTGCEGTWFKYERPGGAPLWDLTRYAMPGARQVCACAALAPKGAESLAAGFLMGKALIGAGPDVGRYVAMARRAPGCFFRGRLTDGRFLRVADPLLRAKALAGEEGIAIAVWNPSAEPREADVVYEGEGGPWREVVDLGEEAMPAVDADTAPAEGHAPARVRFRVTLAAGEARAWLARR